MTDTLPIVSAILGALTAMFTAWVGYLMFRLKHQAEQAAVKVEEVKQVLGTSTAAADRKMSQIAIVAEKTHTLVNSERGATLKALSVALRVIARDRPTAENVAAADAAETASQEHEGKQAVVDEKEKQGTP